MYGKRITLGAVAIAVVFTLGGCKESALRTTTQLAQKTSA